MTRLRVDRFTVTSSKVRLAGTSSNDHCTAVGKMDRVAVARRKDCITISKSFLALLVSFSLLSTPKELIVKSTRGSLTIAVEDDVREIPEGSAYRVVLDPSPAEPQGPRGAGTKGYGGPPIKAARSRFVWYAVGVAGLITVWTVHEALESPDRP